MVRKAKGIYYLDAAGKNKHYFLRLDELGLTPFAVRNLQSSRRPIFTYVLDVAACSKAQLSAISPTTADEVEAKFADRGITLGIPLTGFSWESHRKIIEIERVRATFDPATLGGHLEVPTPARIVIVPGIDM